MTQNPDSSNPEETPEGGPPGGSSEGGRKLDEDAAWRAIVEHYGDEPSLDLPSLDLPPLDRAAPSDPPGEAPPEPEAPRFTVFERRWDPPLNTDATWEDEGHFVPPDPPPLPRLEPRRKLAWIGLFGAPVLLLVAVVLGWQLPGWVSFLLVSGFLGGFCYLVATMPRTRGDDGSGDDGAVV